MSCDPQLGIRSLYQEPARRLLFPLAKRSRDICAPEEKELNMYVPIVQQEAACHSAESAVVQYYEETSATCRLQVQSLGSYQDRFHHSSHSKFRIDLLP